MKKPRASSISLLNNISFKKDKFTCDKEEEDDRKSEKKAISGCRLVKSHSESFLISSYGLYSSTIERDILFDLYPIKSPDDSSSSYMCTRVSWKSVPLVCNNLDSHQYTAKSPLSVNISSNSLSEHATSELVPGTPLPGESSEIYMIPKTVHSLLINILFSHENVNLGKPTSVTSSYLLFICN